MSAIVIVAVVVLVLGAAAALFTVQNGAGLFGRSQRHHRHFLTR